jgi:hypothetical protein
MLVLVLIAAYGCSSHKPSQTSVAEATPAQVNQMCGACHAVPRPGDFAKKMWSYEVHQGYGFYAESFTDKDGHLPHLNFTPPPLPSVLAYFYNRAPETLPILPNTATIGGCPVNFTKAVYNLPGNPTARVSNVSVTHLYDQKHLDIIACQMDPFSISRGSIYVLRPYLPGAKFVKIADLPNPVHTAVVDMDGDGVPDIVVACLGSFSISNSLVGGVVLLKGKRNADGSLSFTPHIILNYVGRVADAEPIDVGGGRKDVVVAEFGHHIVGSIIYLTNETTDWSHPNFVPTVLDKITGTIHVVPCNLVAGHGNRDFVAVCSQEHEQVWGFINKGRGQYDKQLIFQAPHPAIGSSGITLADLNHTGRPSVLYTAGDTFDPHSQLRKDEGVYWLENTGTYPFKAHQLTSMYGCYHAITDNFEGNGRQDIVAVSALPPYLKIDPVALRLDSIIYLQQLPDGQYKRFVLEQCTANYFSCASGDLYNDGHIDFVVGACYTRKTDTSPAAVTIWRNRGPATHIR